MFLRNILLVVGLVALLGGGALTVLWVIAAPTANPAANKTETARQSILIAAHPIAIGTLLRAEDVAWKEIAPADVTPANLVRNQISEADYVGAVARRDFGAGEALVAAGIVDHKERGFLAAVLLPGKRAVSIAVDAPQSSSGLILPGDRVDVILTQSVGGNPANPISETVGETVLRDLRVIAVDQSLSSISRPAAASAAVIGGGNGLQIPKTVTLEVSERGAEKLFVAGALGKLDLAVRALEVLGGPSSHAEATSSPLWGSDVSSALKAVRQAPPKPAPIAGSPVAQTQIEVMHGAKIEAR